MVETTEQTNTNLIEMAANAPKPRGQGRALNAYRHGLTGQVRIFTPEDEKAFRKHCADIHDERKPVGKAETDLTLDVARLKWRISLCEQIEDSLMSIAGDVPSNIQTDNPQIDSALGRAYAWLNNDRSFNLLSLYEGRLRRSHDRAVAQLDAMQEKRQRAERDAAIAARQAAQAARNLELARKAQERQMQPLSKAKSDFVFSAAKTSRSD